MFYRLFSSLMTRRIIVGTKQTVERTLIGIRKRDPNCEGPTFFSQILNNSVEDGMDSPSPSLLKAQLKAAGLTLIVGERSGVNVPIQIVKAPELLEGTSETSSKAPIVLAIGRAPSENEALLLAICAEVRTELAVANEVKNAVST